MRNLSRVTLVANNLTIGHLIGVEALSRFVESDGPVAEYWFADAAIVRLVSGLDFSALEAALALPPSIYVALNIFTVGLPGPKAPGASATFRSAAEENRPGTNRATGSIRIHSPHLCSEAAPAAGVANCG